MPLSTVTLWRVLHNKRVCEHSGAPAISDQPRDPYQHPGEEPSPGEGAPEPGREETAAGGEGGEGHGGEDAEGGVKPSPRSIYYSGPGDPPLPPEEEDEDFPARLRGEAGGERPPGGEAAGGGYRPEFGGGSGYPGQSGGSDYPGHTGEPSAPPAGQQAPPPGGAWPPAQGPPYGQPGGGGGYGGGYEGYGYGGGGGWNDEEAGPAWEQRERLGFARALFMTIAEVLFRPTETFRYARRQGAIGRPLSFLLILWLLTTPVQFALARIVQNTMPGAQGQDFSRLGPEMEQFFRGMTEGSQWMLEAPFFAVLPVVMVLSLVSTVITIGLAVALLHVSLLILGSGAYGFDSTLRAVVYTYAAVLPIGVIPMCGGLLLLLWWTVILIIGLMQIHQTSFWRVLVALHLPLIPACCCIFAAVALLMSMVPA